MSERSAEATTCFDQSAKRLIPSCRAEEALDNRQKGHSLKRDSLNNGTSKEPTRRVGNNAIQNPEPLVAYHLVNAGQLGDSGDRRTSRRHYSVAAEDDSVTADIYVSRG